MAAACSPPVRAKVSCAARSRTGNCVKISDEIMTFESNGGKCWCTASIDDLPHKPQLEEAKTCRVSDSKFTLTAGATKTLSVFSGASLSRQGAISMMSSRFRIKPSLNKKPAANSRSCPGVRMVTATLRPPTRISSGSSHATASWPLLGLAPKEQWRTSTGTEPASNRLELLFFDTTALKEEGHKEKQIRTGGNRDNRDSHLISVCSVGSCSCFLLFLLTLVS